MESSVLGNLSSGLLGGIIGALIGALAAWRIERAQWARDCRKQEWRELLDAVTNAENAATKCSGNTLSSDFERLDVAIAALIRTTRDRLFLPVKTTDAVAVTVAALKLQASLAGMANARNGTMSLAFVRLREALTEEARRNLGIPIVAGPHSTSDSSAAQATAG